MLETIKTARVTSDDPADLALEVEDILLKLRQVEVL
jgi:hypothetical protein